MHILDSKPLPNCKQCGNPFTPPHPRCAYCSIACMQAYEKNRLDALAAERKRISEERKKNIVEKKCTECPNMFFPERKHIVCCSDACRQSRQNRLLRELTAKRKEDAKVKRIKRRAAKEAKKRNASQSQNPS